MIEVVRNKKIFDIHDSYIQNAWIVMWLQPLNDVIKTKWKY